MAPGKMYNHRMVKRFITRMFKKKNAVLYKDNEADNPFNPSNFKELTDTRMIHVQKTNLEKQIDARMISSLNTDYWHATILSPMTRDITYSNIDTDGSSRKEAIDDIRSNTAKIEQVRSEHTVADIARANSSSSVWDSDDEDDDLMAHGGVQDDLTRYMSIPLSGYSKADRKAWRDNPYLFWKSPIGQSMPYLAEYAAHVLNKDASSAGYECIFSKSAFRVGGRKHNTAPEMVDNLGLLGSEYRNERKECLLL